MSEQQSLKPQPSGQIRPSYCMINSSKQLSIQNPKQHLKIIDNIKALNLLKANELNSIYCPHSRPQTMGLNSHQPNLRRSSKPEFSFQHFSQPNKKIDKPDSPALKQKQESSKHEIQESSIRSGLPCLDNKNQIMQTVLGKSQSSQLFELKNLNPESPQALQADKLAKLGRIACQKQNSVVNLEQLIISSSENQQKNYELLDEKQMKKQQIIVKKLLDVSFSQQHKNSIKLKNQKRESLSMISSSGIFTTGNLNTVHSEGQHTEYLPNSPKVFPIVSQKNQLLMKTTSSMKQIFQLTTNSTLKQKSPKILNFLGDSVTFASQQLSPSNNISPNITSFPSSKLLGIRYQFNFPSSLNSNNAELQADQIQASIMNQAPKDSVNQLGSIIQSGELWRMKLKELENEKNELVKILMKERELKDFAIKQLYELISTKSILPTSEAAKQFFQSLIEMNDQQLNVCPQGTTDHSQNKPYSQTLIGENSTQQSEFNQSNISGNQKGSSPKNFRCNNSNLSEQTTFRISQKRSSLPCSPYRKILFDPTKKGAERNNEIQKSEDYLFSSISPLKISAYQNIQTNNTFLTLNQSGLGNHIYSNNMAVDQIGEPTNQNLSQSSILTNLNKLENANTEKNNKVPLLDSLNQIKERITKALLLKQKRQIN